MPWLNVDFWHVVEGPEHNPFNFFGLMQQLNQLPNLLKAATELANDDLRKAVSTLMGTSPTIWVQAIRQTSAVTIGDLLGDLDDQLSPFVPEFLLPREATNVILNLLREGQRFILQPTPNTAIVLRGKMPLARSARQSRRMAPKSAFQRAKRTRPSLNLPKKPTLTVATVTGTASRLGNRYDLQQNGSRTIRVPFFLDRHIPAFALKQLAGMPDGTLFRKRGAEWEVVQIDEQIDVLNPNVVLSLGTVTMLS